MIEHGPAGPPHQVAVLVLDGFLPLDLGIPAQVFARRAGLPYRLTLCAPVPGQVPSASGFSVTVESGLDALGRADTVVVPGFADPLRPFEPAVVGALRAAHARGARMVSICTGAFALAAAGVLDGLSATTHWQYARELAARPGVTVVPEVLYVDEGSVLTSAGVAAGIDLCLHLVRRDLGARTANRLARGLVAAPHREGGQAQFVRQPLPAGPGDSSLAGTRAWALEHLCEPLTVAGLAAHAHMSTRTFARRFTAETGVTPLAWLLTARLDHARELLEHSDLGIDRVAERSGLGSPSNLRLHFRRALGTSPGAYRRAFGAPPADRAASATTAGRPDRTG
ncbi:AraC family transcriptional regulator [Kitasatospora sp. NE20-6]|uniref:GlxA family transcriptional regulator n=1 Tax=Kitasatospora sp. NE20-6 TaxID=2859066 RepID=UPI0034DC4FD8